MRFLKYILSRTSKKPSPVRIPLTGSGIKGQDYYSVSLIRADKQISDLLVQKSGKRGVACREWDGERYSRRQIIPWTELKGACIEIRHYLEGHEFRFNSAGSFFWRETLCLPKLTILKQRISQSIYNARTPVRSSRIELLKRLVERRVHFYEEQRSYRIINENGDSIVTLLTEIYGLKVFGHPRKDAYYARLLIDLDSLIATKDVRMVEIGYVATGNAVETIAVYEQENRQHMDDKIHNRRIFWLTVILAIVGILQIPHIQKLLGIGPNS